MLSKVSASVVVRARPPSCLSPQCLRLLVVPGALASYLACSYDSGLNIPVRMSVWGVHMHVVVVTVANNSSTKRSV